LLQQASANATRCVRRSLEGDLTPLAALDTSAQAFRAAVQMLAVDLKSLMPWHLEQYRPRLPLWRSHVQVLDFLVDFGKVMKEFAAEYASASPAFRAALDQVMRHLADLHDQLAVGGTPTVALDVLQPLAEMNLAGNVHESLFRGKAVEYALLLEKLSKQRPTA
jgi:hypothetical protein